MSAASRRGTVAPQGFLVLMRGRAVTVERALLIFAARETVRRTRAEQGLPPKIEDPVVLDTLAQLLAPHTTSVA
jgi:hypothetical protein